MLLINLFGAPSAGKSTGASYIFSKLKMAGVNAELVTEFAKDKVWEKSAEVFKNQDYIFGKQYFRITRAMEKVDVIVTDSPLLLSAFYADKNSPTYATFQAHVLDVALQLGGLNFFLMRDKLYNPVGRFQTEGESDTISEEILKSLIEWHIPYIIKRGNIKTYDEITEIILSKLGEE